MRGYRQLVKLGGRRGFLRFGVFKDRGWLLSIGKLHLEDLGREAPCFALPWRTHSWASIFWLRFNAGIWKS